MKQLLRQRALRVSRHASEDDLGPVDDILRVPTGELMRMKKMRHACLKFLFKSSCA